MLSSLCAVLLMFGLTCFVPLYIMLTLRYLSLKDNMIHLQIWSPKDRQELMQSLARLLLHQDCTLDISHAFRGLLLDLVIRAKHSLKQSHSHDGNQSHQRFCVALSKLLPSAPELKGLVSFQIQRPL